MLQRAIQCFQAQSYSNKELLVSYPRRDVLSKHVIDRSLAAGLNIIKIERTADVTLGEARNQAITCANGKYICNWDDDDWYHAERLSEQVKHLQGLSYTAPACVLSQLILYDQTKGRSYLSFSYPWENTLMCEKDIAASIKYSRHNRGEDSTLIDFLLQNGQLELLKGMPFLYIYIYHRGNTWGYHHFKSSLYKSVMLDQSVAATIKELVQ